MVTRTSSFRAVLLAVILVLGITAGCSSSSDKASTDTGGATTTAAGGALKSGDVKVTIKDFAFKPEDLKVKSGTKVTWTNEDSADHTATSDGGGDAPAKFDSKNLAKGASYSFTFEKAGTYKYHCSIHASMTGTVTVS